MGNNSWFALFSLWSLIGATFTISHNLMWRLVYVSPSQSLKGTRVPRCECVCMVLLYFRWIIRFADKWHVSNMTQTCIIINTIQNNLAILPIVLGVTRRCQKNGGKNKTKQKHSVHTIIAVSHKVDVERLAIILCFELKFKCSNVITIILKVILLQ